MTYGDIYKEFTEKTGVPAVAVLDFRPCQTFYGVPFVENAIVIWLKAGGKIIFISEKKE